MSEETKRARRKTSDRKRERRCVCFSCRRRKVQEFNIQEELSVLHSRGQCRGSVAAESSRYSTFSSIFLWAVCVCAPLVTLSGTSTLKCQSSAEEKRPGVFKLLCSLSLRVECYLSEDVLSPHIISSGITALASGESSLSFHLFRRL